MKKMMMGKPEKMAAKVVVKTPTKKMKVKMKGSAKKY